MKHGASGYRLPQGAAAARTPAIRRLDRRDCRIFPSVSCSTRLNGDAMANLRVNICGIEFCEPHSAGRRTAVEGWRHAAGCRKRRRGRTGHQDNLGESGRGAAALHGGDSRRISEHRAVVRVAQRAVDRDGVQAGAGHRTARDRRPGILRPIRFANWRRW